MKMLRSFKAVKFWKKLDIGFGKSDVHQNDQQNDANYDPSCNVRGNGRVAQLMRLFW